MIRKGCFLWIHPKTSLPFLVLSSRSSYSIDPAVANPATKDSKTAKVLSTKKTQDPKASSNVKKEPISKKERDPANGAFSLSSQVSVEDKAAIFNARTDHSTAERGFEVRSSLEEFNSAFGIAAPIENHPQNPPLVPEETDVTNEKNDSAKPTLSSIISTNFAHENHQFNNAPPIPKSISKFFPVTKKVPRPKSAPSCSREDASPKMAGFTSSNTEYTQEPDKGTSKPTPISTSYSGITPNSAKSNDGGSNSNFFNNQRHRGLNSSHLQGGLVSIVPKDAPLSSQDHFYSLISKNISEDVSFCEQKEIIFDENSASTHQEVNLKKIQESVAPSLDVARFGNFSSSSFERSEASIVKSISFAFPANQASVISLLNLYDRQLDYNATRDLKIEIFLKTLRLLFYLYKPTVFSASTIFNISKLKCIAEESSNWRDISLVFPLERMLPSSKSFQDSRITFPIEVHIAVMSILDKIRAKLFAYEYYLEFLMKDPVPCSNPILLRNVIKALSSHQFASKSVFDHFLRNGGIPTPDIVVDLLATPNLIDSACLYESYFDQYIKIPYLEQKILPEEAKKIDDRQLLQATKSMLGICKLEQKTPECHTLFVRNRDLGVVCNLLPPVFQKRETAYYVVACTGPSFHIYDVEKLDLLFIGPHYDTLYRPSSGESASICAIAAVGDLTIVAILPFGVLSFCERAKETFSMKIDGFSPSNPIVQLDNIGDRCIEFLHPSTYLNKLLVATNDHHVSLWNFRSGKHVHTLKSLAILPRSPIMRMTQTPALDVIAISFLNGTFGFFDIKKDQLLFRLQQPGGGASCFCFRTGHSSPPSLIGFYGDDGHFILSSGVDCSFRVSSLYKDSQAFELSQAKEHRAVGPFSSFVSTLSPYSSKGGSAWDNILSCHHGSSFSQSWSFDKKSIGSHRFASSDGSAVVCCALSHCGHFGFVGTDSGHVEIYNMQSGLHRGTINHGPAPVSAVCSSSDGAKFLSLSLEHLQLVVKFWTFKNRRQQHTENLPLAFERQPGLKAYFAQHFDSDMVAIAAGCQIFVFDFCLQKAVRVFNAPPKHTINSISFSGDGKWVVTAGNDFCVNIWDIPSGSQYHSLNIYPVLPTGAALSPNGETLAIIDATSVSIKLW
ncbi:hypothetical protein DI09_6p170 [Mitosporidium daphniae]|uniref:WDR36/Utp21 N-terminal domain-containing protein n=1 Tax=Mitosporidium daphniae TaxID=1485682 RepID=A0A098VN22_9MICR|nr:uncharacterized protein DI09_6p170 [Mitosporidium daphniae]KGG50433.1 hypothetical protein DI09_6p170 [Mitosporidium daphniae]|eukprot:XP_013236860.1 uncharacterized protein DI09_6p170 [Mitosporidium daphniae]